MTGVVYRILNTIIDKEYIGSTINFHTRKIVHFSKSAKMTDLQKDMDKYGRDKFECSVLLEISHEDQDELVKNLRIAEENFRLKSTNCYNRHRAINLFKRKEKDGYEVRSIRLKNDVLAKLNKMAEDDRRSFVSLVEIILSDYAKLHSKTTKTHPKSANN